MNVKRTIFIGSLVILTLVLIFLAPIAWKITGGLRTPARPDAPDYWPTTGWRSVTPEAQGFDSAKMAEGLQAMQESQMDIDSLLIIRNGYVVLDAHFDPYDGSFPHDLASVTKSVVTTLIAIAAEQGKLDLDQPVVSFFPERTVANLDERKARMTVRHLAGMVGGMQSLCYDGDGEELQAMRAASDWVQAALDRPMVAEPGEQFCYDSPSFHLLSAILQQATGLTALDFARQFLFEPLGIQQAIWDVDPQGRSRGWGDLHLLPEDLAKIGLLWLQRGDWDGQQIVSEAWVLDSVKAHSKFIQPDYGYGYGWWISLGDYMAAGRGGQKLRVMASVDTILVVTGSEYDYSAIEAWLLPMLLSSKTRLPASPQGVAALEAVLSGLVQPADAWSATITPEIAAQVSGRTYLCGSNPAAVQTVRTDFSAPEQATMYLTMDGAQSTLPIGLDGSYRFSADGWGYRGYWEDARTFHFEGFDIGILSRQVVFDGDGMTITLPEANLTIACQLQDT